MLKFSPNTAIYLSIYTQARTMLKASKGLRTEELIPCLLDQFYPLQNQRFHTDSG